jgi:signal transduction histidine kinase
VSRTTSAGTSFATVTDMTDLDRVLESLLHDLRSPLGVAGGYLRLLREQRLGSVEESERAIVKTQDALRTMTALCGDASEWLKAEPAGPPAAVAVETLVGQLAADCERQRVPLDVAAGLGGTVSLTADTERIARAVAALLSLVTRDTTARSQVRVEDGVLRVAAVATQPRPGGHDGVFDPWTYPGLAAALACRTIALAGGRCLRGPGATIVRVEFALSPDAAAA